MVLVLFTMRLMLLQNCCMVVRFVASYIKNNILAISNTILKFDCVLRAHFTVSQKTSMVWRWNILNYITMTMIVDPLWRIYDEIGFKLSSKLNKSIWSVLNLLVLLKNCLFWSQFEILNEHCTDCRVLGFDHVYSGIDFWTILTEKKSQTTHFFPFSNERQHCELLKTRAKRHCRLDGFWALAACFWCHFQIFW